MRCPAVTLLAGEDASLYLGLSHLPRAVFFTPFSSLSLSPISIADLSHSGAESLLGVSIFNYLAPPISATLSPL